jgi:hypothetical protein
MGGGPNGHRGEVTAVVCFAVGAVVLTGVLLLFVAVLDRRRSDRLEHDVSRLDADPTHEPLHDPAEAERVRRRVRR